MTRQQDEMNSDRSSMREINELFLRTSDSFDKLIADGTTNELDLASQYTFNPEKHRLFLNDVRQFPHYGPVPEFTDDVDTWKLQPGDGDTMHIESAESATYTVQYVLQTSFAFQLNQSLQSGDSIKIGAYNGTDGWYLEHRGEQTDLEVDLVRERNGTKKILRENVKLDEPVTTYQRIELRYNWYNVGEQVWVQTYIDADDKQQRNTILARTGEQQRGPATGNLNLWQEINQAAGNTGTELFVGSMSAVTLGNTTNLTRNKGDYEKITLPSTNDDTWVPLLAARLDPDKDNINAQLTQLDILQYGGNADLECIVVSVDDDRTDATDFSAPKYQHSYNSAIQTTTNITQVPRASDGTQVTLDSTEKPGGHTLGSAQLLSGGGQSQTASEATEAREVKKPILASDHLVFLFRSPASGSNVEFTWEASQNY